ncbi:uncharacterized protein V1513DRAFT_203111 [Lipomyces chichibuensis]|uniref:uncharacterized protein n=1 Tax=Lipomyces chichibuensis TaxID=1546026 RepID=UPI003343A6E6
MTAAVEILVKQPPNKQHNVGEDDLGKHSHGEHEKSSTAAVAEKLPRLFATSNKERNKISEDADSSDDTDSSGKTGFPYAEREAPADADETVPRIRRVSSDSNVPATLRNSSEPTNGEQIVDTPTAKHKRLMSLPQQRALTFAESSSPTESRDETHTPHTPENGAGWGKLFSAADGWLDRLRTAMATEEGEAGTSNRNSVIDKAQEDRRDTASSDTTSPVAPKASMPRRATISAISDSVKSRKIAPSLMRFAGFHNDESGSRHGSTLDVDAGEQEHHGAIAGLNPHRWKEIRSTLRFMNFTKKKKEEDITHDHEKSAALIAELSAGAPAAVILASSFKRDEKGQRRLPVLLEQLKVKITDSTRQEDRQHTIFRIELEYGSGPTRMKWVIHRDFRDFFTLHSRLRMLNIQRNIYSSTTGGTMGVTPAPDIPHFPKAAIPYLRGVRGLIDESDGDKLSILRRGGLNSKQSLVSVPTEDSPIPPSSPGPAYSRGYSHTQSQQASQKHFKFIENQRHQLEAYLKSLIQLMIFQGDANRICKFLELSAMGLRLSIERSYHGKEGQLSVISTSSSRSWRTQNLRPKHIISMFTRYKPKWFLIRHSYILVVDSMLDVVPVDVIMVDGDFKYSYKARGALHREDNNDAEGDENGNRQQKSITRSVQESTKLRVTLKLENSERKVKLLALSDKQMKQWIDSIEYMQSHTLWSKSHRFDSFAPVRYNVSAQWFVDGRDYFWNVSHAIDMAKDVIYIHDWWLSPEIYLRRPAHGNQQWRLDRLLKRKAEEGVKIFVILYRNVGAAIPIDSQYTKQSLLDLHRNIFVARSPNQFRQNILFWAHHEKLVIVDHVIAFIGGLDLCFGRWDTPQHVLTDNKPTGFDRGSRVDFGQDTQLWVGKDYSNARVQDFYELHKPYDDMYDRAKVPRMPWHDVHMQIVGQPARDAARHFVQRWNYLIRQKHSTRPAPVLLPPPDFTDAEIEIMGHLGTCEVQLLRSACGWSLGMRNDKVEHSILNAYLKAIEQSDHFVYIENQFFISSTTVDGTVIENQIGDALVERIMRAHKHDENWRAVIIIPLMPGFEAEVDQQDGTSVRLIMQCQFRTISRGPNSIFGRLERAGINPEDYVQFFALRKWGFVGPSRQLVTEQLYIHAKILVVDDRVAIIGSANINERSMRGSRDSEVAAFVRDTDQIESSMGGQPYMVGRFPHTLRVRLMREHLGIDVDALDELERQAMSPAKDEQQDIAFDLNRQNIWTTLEKLRDVGPRPQSMVHDEAITNDRMYESHVEEESNSDHIHSDDDSSFVSLTSSAAGPSTSRFRVNSTDGKGPVIDPYGDEIAESSADAHRNSSPNFSPMEMGIQDLESQQHEIDREFRAADLAGYGPDRMHESGEAEAKMEEAIRRRIREKRYSEVVDASDREHTREISLPAGHRLSSANIIEEANELPNHIDANVERPTEEPVDFERRIGSLTLDPAKSYLADTEMREILETETKTLKSISPFSFEDPLDESFYYDIWLAHALNNTNIYREVFRCQPDNEVRTWKDYKAYVAHGEKFAQMQRGTVFGFSEDRAGRKLGPQSGSGAGGIGTTANNGPFPAAVAVEGERMVSNISSTLSNAKEQSKDQFSPDSTHGNETMIDKHTGSDDDVQAAGSNGTGSRRRRRATDSSIHPGTTRRARRKRSSTIDNVLDKEAAENMLNDIRGHLIVFPSDWLLKEEEAGNWFYNIDRIPPIEIYD